MPVLSVSVLGPLVVLRDMRPVDDFGYNKVRALLAYLAVESGRPHPRMHLCTLLWPDQPDRASRRNLSQALTQLRRALGGTAALAGGAPLLLADSDEVQLNPGAGLETDLAQFIRQLEACERHPHRAWHICTVCAEREQAALDLYRGDFLVGLSLPDSVPFEEWAFIWRERLRQRALSALERLAGWAEWRGAFTQAAAFARRSVELDWPNEAAHRQAMRLFGLDGAPATATAQFDALKRMLAVEFGLAPEAESVALNERIRAAISGSQPAGTPGGEHALAGLRRFRAPAFNGPTAPNALLGREEAMAAVIARLRDDATRTLTLTGPPGIGKTRLALQVASDLRFDFEHGVHVVELAPLAEAAVVPAAVARALEVKEVSGQPLALTLTAHLKSRHLLLLLDNFEHVLDAAGFVADLLSACPALRILVTSRAPLRIRAEQLLAIQPLGESDAQRLFVQRAGALTPPADPDPAIAAICRRLDHLPLAIELIAVRARSMPPSELLRQLDQPLSALIAAPRDVPDRHRTLRAAIGWSYDRLEAGEQRLFRHLAVFPGGATPEAAQAVVGSGPSILPVLEALHEASLVQSQSGAVETRLTLLETLREYAQEELDAWGETGAARRRQVDHYLALAERARPALQRAEPGHWLNQLERELDNFRAVLVHAQTLDDDTELRLAAALGSFWEVRGYLAEGRRWLTGALERRPQAAPAVRGDAFEQAGILAYRQGDYKSARGLHERGLDLWQQLEEGAAIARSLRHLGNVVSDLGDLAAAQPYYEQSLAIARELGDVPGIAAALNSLGLTASNQGDLDRAWALHAEALPIVRELGDQSAAGLVLNNLGLVAMRRLGFDEAQRHFEESLATFRAIGYKWGKGLVLLNLGNLARTRGRWPEAQTWHEKSLALFRELGDLATASYPIFGLGEVALEQGKFDLARTRFRESLTLRTETGEKRPIPRNLDGFGQLDRREGRPERATQLFGAAQALRERLGLNVTPEYAAEHESETTALRDLLGQAAFDAAWSAGRALTLEQAVALALQGELGE